MVGSLRGFLSLQKEAAKKKSQPVLGLATPFQPTPLPGAPRAPMLPGIGLRVTPPSPFPAAWKVPTDPRRQQELQMWKDWKDSQEDPTKLQPLLTSLQPLISKQVRVLSRTPIPVPIIEAEATKHTIEALRKYDPIPKPGKQGTQIHTWVTNQLKGMNRYIQSNQNMRRITEERSQLVGPFQRATAHLREELGREPTHLEISDYMNEMPDRVDRARRITPKQVKLLSQEMTPDLLASVEMENPFIEETPQERELMKLIVYDLSPDELHVFEFIRGLNGKKKTSSTGQIAKSLGWSASKVSQVKNKIAKKIDGYLKS
jgi:DNA-directed RNA polymerase specialized sigma subunit